MPNTLENPSIQPHELKIEAMCRLCQKVDNDTVTNNIQQCTDFIQAIAQISVSSDPRLPSLVCNECVERLLDAFMIREMCIDSEQRLLRMIDDVESVEEDIIDYFDPVKVETDCDEEVDADEYVEQVSIEGVDSIEEELLQMDEERLEDERTGLEVDGLKGEQSEELPKPVNRNKVVVVDPPSRKLFMIPTRRQRSKQKKIVTKTKRERSPIVEGETENKRKYRKAKLRQRELLEEKQSVHKFMKCCCQCDEVFLKKNEVKQHFVDEHIDVRPLIRPTYDYICYLCWEIFDSMDSLLTHLKQPDMKVHKCETCTNFSALTIDMLRRHKKLVHGIEEIFQCEMCPREFNHFSSLKGHRDKVHYKITYVCDVCGKAFKNVDNLRGHKNVHEGVFPYACHVCEFRCARKSNLDAHMRSHTGSKPYKCPYCEKSFSFITDRKRHIPTHTGEYPYTCEICKKGFVRKKFLEQHHEIHT